MPSRPRIAIAHDYLTQSGGAERVVLAMARAFPEAEIHTLLYQPSTTLKEFEDFTVVTSPLNSIGPLRSSHRAALPVLAPAASAMSIDADIVIASSSGWAHGIRVTGKKLVYCYSPARWLYQTDQYLGPSPSLAKRMAVNVLKPLLKRWDARAASSADRYLAISSAVADRIQQTYGIRADIVPAPVTIGRSVTTELTDVAVQELLGSEPYFLIVSRLLPYKNVDVAVRTFSSDARHGRLVVVGIGPELDNLRGMAASNVTFLSGLTDGEMHWLYSHCRAVIGVSYEDYGLTPIEAALHGRPSVVLRWGGYLDTMVDGVTAVFVDEPTPEALATGLDDFASRTWDEDHIRLNVDRFSEESFATALRGQVLDLDDQ